MPAKASEKAAPRHFSASEVPRQQVVHPAYGRRDDVRRVHGNLLWQGHLPHQPLGKSMRPLVQLDEGQPRQGLGTLGGGSYVIRSGFAEDERRDEDLVAIPLALPPSSVVLSG